MSEENYEQITLPVESLIPDEVGLRTDVDKESEHWQHLLESVQANGVLEPIQIRKVKLSDDSDQYVIINGMHRWEASREAGLDTIPCILYKNVTPRDILDMQVITNVHRIETKPMEYAQHFQRILSESALNDEVPMTQKDLAKRLKVSPAWISGILRLNKLIDPAKKLVEDSKISLANAIYLARLPIEEQEHWIDRAQTQSPDDFAPDAAARASELKRRPGKAGKPQEFNPNAKLRTKNELLEVYHKIAPQFDDIDTDAIDTTTAEYVKGYWDGVAFSLSLDDETVQQKKEEYEARLAEQQEKKAAKLREKVAEEASEHGIVNLLNKDGRRPIGAN